MPLKGGIGRMIPVHTSTQEVSLPFKGSFPLAGSNRASSRPYVAWLLLFCIFAIIFRQTVLVRQRATTVDFSAVDTFAYLDIATVCLAAFVLLCSGSLGRTWSALRRTPAVWLCGYYLICAASFIWSVAPVYSLYRAIEYFVLFFATCAAVAQYQDFIKAEQVFLRVAMATILLQMCINLRLLGFSLSLKAWHTNSYSATSAMLFCYCLGEYLATAKSKGSEAKKRSRRLLLFGIFSFGTLALGTSAASNVAAAVGCLLIFLALRRFGLLLATLFVGFLLAILGGGEELVRNLLLPGKTEHQLETVSGRILIWELYWRKFLQSPILGYGFGVIREGRYKEAFAALSHNSFYSVLIGTGSVGLAFFGMFAAKLWWTTIDKVWRRGPGTVGFVGALAAAFVNCLAMPLMADRWSNTSFVFVWLLGLFLLYVRGSRQVASAPGGILSAADGTH